MMRRIKIEPITAISQPMHTDTQKLKQALRISQQQGLIRPTGDPSLDAPPSKEEKDAKDPPKTS
jgi:predicted transcriptional regulator